MEIIIFLAILGLGIFGFNWLMGYRNNHITIDLDDRYVDFKEYVEAIQIELANQGREVSYIGSRKFIIDGQTYIFIERNVSMGGVPLQRTILKPEK
ncbi:hypothetical protein [Cytobacillus firmus]|uniref:hypothetical protein n=1 Tax=Cytobacillus firmus TaxID=1399 RepID=UPI0018CEE4EE|nr:hypothetical protein [Cytobacillus firmus]MBG9548969.1 hypothetical protein [Cytobacillus firmus]MBG9604076.1 hypothetical protein [Cytobacillus firmus]MBG9653914.1 hypothetical protein [Cytobacillus firmus]MED1905280.1 hypothetical protein [Cytobacillus firmus]MED1939369.1 hypothetical protein [Cytobacillus firmus]